MKERDLVLTPEMKAAVLTRLERSWDVMGLMAGQEPFDAEAVNPRYGTARMSDVALALMRPKNEKVAAIIEARRDELEDI